MSKAVVGRCKDNRHWDAESLMRRIQLFLSVLEAFSLSTKFVGKFALSWGTVIRLCP